MPTTEQIVAATGHAWPDPPAPRFWNAMRLATCFADRLGLAGAEMADIRNALASDPSEPIARDPSPALIRLLAGTAAYLAGVAARDLARFLVERGDVLAAAAAAIRARDQGWVYQHQRGTVTVAVHIPASFTVYLHILSCRIREELDAQAA